MANKSFVQTERFYGHLGRFYAVWNATELNIDWVIGKILKITPEQTHALVAGMMFGRKAALLRSLLPKSDYKNVSELKGFLTRLKNESLRNVFTHSLIFSDLDGVTFVHRKSQDDYSAKVTASRRMISAGTLKRSCNSPKNLRKCWRSRTMNSCSLPRRRSRISQNNNWFHATSAVCWINPHNASRATSATSASLTTRSRPRCVSMAAIRCK